VGLVVQAVVFPVPPRQVQGHRGGPVPGLRAVPVPALAPARLHGGRYRTHRGSRDPRGGLACTPGPDAGMLGLERGTPPAPGLPPAVPPLRAPRLPLPPARRPVRPGACTRSPSACTGSCPRAGRDRVRCSHPVHSGQRSGEPGSPEPPRVLHQRLGQVSQDSRNGLPCLPWDHALLQQGREHHPRQGQTEAGGEPVQVVREQRASVNAAAARTATNRASCTMVNEWAMAPTNR
jgi:hypothetical protein